MHHFNFHVLDEKMNNSVARYSQIVKTILNMTSSSRSFVWAVLHYS